MTRESSDAVATTRDQQRTRLVRRGWKLLQGSGKGLGRWVHPGLGLLLHHSESWQSDQQLWAEVEIARRHHRALPTWADVRAAVDPIYPEQYGILVIVPKSRVGAIDDKAVHVWVCVTRQFLPDHVRGAGV